MRRFDRPTMVLVGFEETCSLLILQTVLAVPGHRHQPFGNARTSPRPSSRTPWRTRWCSSDEPRAGERVLAERSPVPSGYGCVDLDRPAGGAARRRPARHRGPLGGWSGHEMVNSSRRSCDMGDGTSPTPWATVSRPLHTVGDRRRRRDEGRGEGDLHRRDAVRPGTPGRKVHRWRGACYDDLDRLLTLGYGSTRRLVGIELWPGTDLVVIAGVSCSPAPYPDELVNVYHARQPPPVLDDSFYAGTCRRCVDRGHGGTSPGWWQQSEGRLASRSRWLSSKTELSSSRCSSRTLATRCALLPLRPRRKCAAVDKVFRGDRFDQRVRRAGSSSANMYLLFIGVLLKDDAEGTRLNERSRARRCSTHREAPGTLSRSMLGIVGGGALPWSVSTVVVHPRDADGPAPGVDVSVVPLSTRRPLVLVSRLFSPAEHGGWMDVGAERSTTISQGPIDRCVDGPPSVHRRRELAAREREMRDGG